MALRTDKAQKRYNDHIKQYDGHCIFCANEEWILDLEYWSIKNNPFPYDKIAENHVLLYPKRHIQKFSELNKDELDEFNKVCETDFLLKEHKINFDFYLVNKGKAISVPIHLHIHLVKFKK